MNKHRDLNRDKDNFKVKSKQGISTETSFQWKNQMPIKMLMLVENKDAKSRRANFRETRRKAIKCSQWAGKR